MTMPASARPGNKSGHRLPRSRPRVHIQCHHGHQRDRHPAPGPPPRPARSRHARTSWGGSTSSRGRWCTASSWGSTGRPTGASRPSSRKTGPTSRVTTSGTWTGASSRARTASTSSSTRRRRTCRAYLLLDISESMAWSSRPRPAHQAVVRQAPGRRGVADPHPPGRHRRPHGLSRKDRAADPRPGRKGALAPAAPAPERTRGRRPHGFRVGDQGCGDEAQAQGARDPDLRPAGRPCGDGQGPGLPPAHGARGAGLPPHRPGRARPADDRPRRASWTPRRGTRSRSRWRTCGGSTGTPWRTRCPSGRTTLTSRGIAYSTIGTDEPLSRALRFYLWKRQRLP